MSKTRKTPLRKCIVTGEQHDKRELMRVVRNKEGIVSVDPTGKAHGRGAYLKLDKTVINKARKKNLIAKHFGVSVEPEIYDQLEALINNE